MVLLPGRVVWVPGRVVWVPGRVVMVPGRVVWVPGLLVMLPGLLVTLPEAYRGNNARRVEVTVGTPVCDALTVVIVNGIVQAFE